MRKPRLTVSFALVMLAIIVIGVLTYVSILGENDKIDRMIGEYFNNVKSGNYLEASNSFASNVQGNQRSDDEQRETFNFFLELTLLKHYTLLDQYDYTVELKKSDFWIPYVSDNRVRVGILLKKKDEQGIFRAGSHSQGGVPLNNFIVVVRERGAWKIRQFNITDSAIADMYTELRTGVELNRYVQRTSDGFQLKNAHLNLMTLSPLDKRVLRFSLYTIQKSLGSELLPKAEKKSNLF
jgi:hypothetical protein